MLKSRASYRLGAAASRFVSELTFGALVGLPFVKKMSQMVLMIARTLLVNLLKGISGFTLEVDRTLDRTW